MPMDVAPKPQWLLNRSKKLLLSMLNKVQEHHLQVSCCTIKEQPPQREPLPQQQAAGKQAIALP